MDLKNLTEKAKELIDKRGGAGSLKGDADELKDIASSDESLTEKAKDAIEAIKEPGEDAVAVSPPPAPAQGAPGAPPEAERGGGGGGHHGKHGHGGQGGGGGGPRGGGGRRGRRERGGRDRDPGV
jgi:hypothetical protein